MQKSLALLTSIFLFASLFVSLYSVEPAEAQLNVLTRYDYYMPVSGLTTATGGAYQGQTFTASATYNATVVSLHLQVSTAPFPTSTWFYVFNVGVNGLPSTEIYRSTISFSGFSGGWYNVSIASGVALTVGHQYFIGIAYGPYSNQVRMSYVTAGTYDGGMRITGTDLPPTGASPAQDCAFQVFGYPIVVAGDFSYTFVGPIFEADPQSSSTALLTLTGRDGSSNQVSVATGQSYTWTTPLAAVSWNFSSILNHTRTIEFLPTDGTPAGMQTFQLFAASPDYVLGVYVFNVVDYTGEAQFIEVNLGGVVVERRSLGLSGSADFTLYRGLSYSLNVISLRSGVFSQLFTAGNIYSSNVILLANSFGEAPLGAGLVEFFSAVRSDNNSLVTIFFSSSVNTGCFNFTIYKNVGSNLVSVFNGSVLGAYLPLNFVYSEAELSSDYTVQGFYYDSNGVLLKSWSVSVAARFDRANPWGALLYPFGVQVNTFPGSAVLPAGFDLAQVPAAIILLFVLAIFSWKSHSIGCLLAWVVALVMVAMGWFVVSLPAFGFALFMAIFIVFVEGKRTERDL